MRSIVILFFATWVPPIAWSQTRLATHVTRVSGGYETAVLLENVSDEEIICELQPFSSKGDPLTKASFPIAAHITVESSVETLFAESSEVTHFQVLNPATEVDVTIRYEATSENSSPAHLKLSTLQSKSWKFYPGDWSQVFDGVALVNTGNVPTEVALTQVAFEGSIIQTLVLVSEFQPMSKIISVIGGPSGSEFTAMEDTYFQITANQPLSLIALRGTVPGAGANFLWENTTTTGNPEYLIEINDPALRSLIVNTLEIPENSPIWKSQAMQLTHLSGIEQGIKDLTGLQEFENLQSIDFYGNQISDIAPIKNLKQLTTLSLSYNDLQLNDLTFFASFPGLKTLALGDCGIQSLIGVEQLNGLEVLALYQNQIQDLNPISGNEELIELWLWQNQLTDLGALSTLRNLKLLSAPENEINDLSPLSSLTQLEVLALYQNSITDLSPISNLFALKELWLWQNNILDLAPLSGLTDLGLLSVPENQVSNLAPISSLVNLKTLAVYSNQISDITPITNVTGLLELWAGANPISDLTAISNLTSLIVLSLPDTRISDLSFLSPLTNLTQLFLYLNLIDDLQPISGLVDLQYLEIWSNAITNLAPTSGLNNLLWLEAHDNQIRDINALVNNPGIGPNDYVNLGENALDGGDCGNIQTLLNRQVFLTNGTPLDAAPLPFEFCGSTKNNSVQSIQNTGTLNKIKRKAYIHANMGGQP